MRSTSGLYVGAGLLTNYVIGKRGILKIIRLFRCIIMTVTTS